MSQVTLEAITEDLHRSRSAALLPALEAGLNQQQLQAFAHDDGPCLVLAGAGSGKTTVLTRRVARLLARGTDPQRIFVATFTKKAAEEMGSRLASQLGEGGEAIVEKMWIGTFHSHCLRILKFERAHLFGKAGYFQLADENWQIRVAKAILGDKDWMARGLPSPPFGLNVAYDPKGALSAVSAVKNRGFRVEEAEAAFRAHEPLWADPSIQLLAKFWRCYEQAKQAKFDILAKKPSRRLDFDDLLIEALVLLQEQPAIRKKYQEFFQYLCIDETQDTFRQKALAEIEIHLLEAHEFPAPLHCLDHQNRPCGRHQFVLPHPAVAKDIVGRGYHQRNYGRTHARHLSNPQIV